MTGSEGFYHSRIGRRMAVSMGRGSGAGSGDDRVRRPGLLRGVFATGGARVWNRRPHHHRPPRRPRSPSSGTPRPTSSMRRPTRRTRAPPATRESPRPANAEGGAGGFGRGQPFARRRRQGRARRATRSCATASSRRTRGLGPEGARVVQADDRRSRARDDHGDPELDVAGRQRGRDLHGARPARPPLPARSGESTVSFQMSFGR